MKNIITLLIALLISISIFAQQGINYKAILKDPSGNVLVNTFMNIQFSIHQTTATGTVVYQEDHNYTTDANGLVILTIGSDTTPSVGTFDTIDWSADLHFLQTTINYVGGAINFDATEFKAVPYAKHAIKATNVTVMPRPYILGRSSQTSNAKFSFNGKYGWQAAQEMCMASYPGDPNVRAFTLEQIAQAIVLSNWDTNNLSNIENIFFWGITPYAVGTTYTNEAHRNNVWGLNHSSGDTSRGVRGKIIINANTIVGENPNGANPSNTYLEVDSNMAAGNYYSCMCGTYN